MMQIKQECQDKNAKDKMQFEEAKHAASKQLKSELKVLEGKYDDNDEGMYDRDVRVCI